MRPEDVPFRRSEIKLFNALDRRYIKFVFNGKTCKTIYETACIDCFLNKKIGFASDALRLIYYKTYVTKELCEHDEGIDAIVSMFFHKEDKNINIQVENDDKKYNFIGHMLTKSLTGMGINLKIHKT